MVSVAQSSRRCVLLLLFRTRSIFPISFFTLALAALTAPKTVALPAADINKSILILPATISTLSVEKSSSVSQSYSTFSSPARTPQTLSKLPFKTDSNAKSSTLDVANLPITSKNIHLFGKEVSPSPYSGHCCHTFFYPVQPLKLISWLPSNPCKHLNLSHKATAPFSHKHSQSPHTKSCLYPLSTGKVHLQLAKTSKTQSPLPPASLSPLSNSTSPQSALKKRLAPLPVSPLSAALTFKTTLPALSKTSPLLPYNTTSSSPEATTPRLAPAHLPHTVGPLFEHQPFIVTWNIPDLVCKRYNVSLDTSAFKGVATPAKVRVKR